MIPRRRNKVSPLKRGLVPWGETSFADGRIFTGQQALALGVVDRLGTEAEAQRWLAELAGLDPDKVEHSAATHSPSSTDRAGRG